MDDPFERRPNAAQYNQTELFSKGWRIRRSLLEDGTLRKWEREDRKVSWWRNG
jgi:hypothetical protein